MSANILDGCAAEVTEFKIFFDPDNGLPSSPGTFTVYSKSSHVMLIGVKLNALCDASASTFEIEMLTSSAFSPSFFFSLDDVLDDPMLR
jgi:hypothetical protein